MLCHSQTENYARKESINKPKNVCLSCGKRTEDKILVENGIESIQDLSECYCQIRNKVSNLSKKVRDLVIKKYSEIINNYNFDK